MIPFETLNTGQKMPVLGLGTWLLTGQKCTQSVSQALELGYTHIDTAKAYENHREIASALENFDRKKIFITSKIWLTDLEPDAVGPACNQILKDLETDYLDLLLIHWPNKSVPVSETLGAMNDLAKQGKTKAIGVSNFTISHLKEALDSKAAKISVNQVEFHPLLYQKGLLEFCKSKGISVTAYCPLGRQGDLRHRAIKEIAERNERTAAQVCLRWLVQKGLVVIPKASSESHLEENMQIFDWELSNEDVEAIDSINRNKRVCNPTFADFNNGSE
ncbi:MAG: aldo/keto reductase [archaeon]|jgi:diketogulonate reductase-like aldo/keto reductase|nr:aldo/keto reductase [archaeon]